MKTRYLFPYSWRYMGWIILVIGLLFFAITTYADIEVIVVHNLRASVHSQFSGINVNECFDNEIQLTLTLIGLLLIAFSKEKIEDEQIRQLRLDCLQWAVYINYAIFFVLIFAFYSLAFLYFVLYNTFTLLLFFILRFRWVVYKNSKLPEGEIRMI